MKTLTTWFTVFDLFGGNTNIFYTLTYVQAVKLAEKQGYTFSAEFY